MPRPFDAARCLAEIFDAPDCALEPDAYDAWAVERDAAEDARRLNLREAGLRRRGCKVRRY